MSAETLAVFAIYVFLFVLGTLIGNRFTKWIFRLSLPRGERRGHSCCPNCGRRLRVSDQIPILSYLSLGGKCRRCHEKISPMYPLTELLGGVLFVFCPYWFSFSPHGFLVALAVMVLYALALIDHRSMRLPDAFVIALAVIAVADLFASPEITLELRLYGMIPAILLWIVRILSRGGIGLGDVKLAFAAGFLLGYPGADAMLILAILLGGLWALVLILRGVKKMPLGPWMCLCYGAGLFFPVEISNFWEMMMRFFLG